MSNSDIADLTSAPPHRKRHLSPASIGRWQARMMIGNRKRYRDLGRSLAFHSALAETHGGIVAALRTLSILPSVHRLVSLQVLGGSYPKLEPQFVDA